MLTEAENKFSRDVASILCREAPGEQEAWLRQTLTSACRSVSLEHVGPALRRRWTDFVDKQVEVESPFAERLLTTLSKSRQKEIGGLFLNKPKLFREFFFNNEKRIT